MNRSRPFAMGLIGLLAIGVLLAQEPKQPGTSGEKVMSEKVLFEKMTGKWSGTCKTWFEPGKLADQSAVKGEFASVMDGRFLRHTYQGSMKSKPRSGEELIGFNAVTKQFQSSWVDDFHMNYAILFSQGPPARRGFHVTGEYDVGEDQPRWGWRTEYALQDDDHLTIIAYNIQPDGTEAKAVETIYQRVTPADRSGQ